MSATSAGAKSIPCPSRSAAKRPSKPKPHTRRKSSSPSNRDTKSNPQATGESAASKSARIQSDPAAHNSNGASSPARIHTTRAPSNGKPAASAVASTQVAPAAYAFLALAAETLEDIERVRIAAENRVRALTHPEQNIHLQEDDPVVKAASELAGGLAAIEKDAEKAVKRVVRQTPLGPWVKETVGIGEKQAGRLLGVIGNPRFRVDGETGEIYERTVGQLWAYCGYSVQDGVAPRRKRGEQGNWNPKARMRAYLIAESCMKSLTSPYRKVYEDARDKYAEAVHQHPCAQCGKKGKPAEPGTELRDGHKHARALRIVAKEMLRDMWLAAGPRASRMTNPAASADFAADQS